MVNKYLLKPNDKYIAIHVLSDYDYLFNRQMFPVYVGILSNTNKYRIIRSDNSRSLQHVEKYRIYLVENENAIVSRLRLITI